MSVFLNLVKNSLVVFWILLRKMSKEQWLKEGKSQFVKKKKPKRKALKENGYIPRLIFNAVLFQSFQCPDNKCPLLTVPLGLYLDCEAMYFLNWSISCTDERQKIEKSCALERS